MIYSTNRLQNGFMVVKHTQKNIHFVTESEKTFYNFHDFLGNNVTNSFKIYMLFDRLCTLELAYCRYGS